jgi:hypothetical protein
MLFDPTLAAPQHSLAEQLIRANESHWWVLKRPIHAFSGGGFLGFMLIFSVFFFCRDGLVGFGSWVFVAVFEARFK